MKATGTFEVELKPAAGYLKGKNGINAARMTIDKTWHGDLSGTSQGEMLSAMTSTKGSAGYVAIEQVSAELSGKKGSFVLQHFGIMDKGNDRLILEVVPDSASGELEGLSGRLSISIDDGIHSYEFNYR